MQDLFDGLITLEDCVDCDWVGDFMDFLSFHKHGENFSADVVFELRREERDELEEWFDC